MVAPTSGFFDTLKKAAPFGAAFDFPLTNATCAVVVCLVVAGVQIRDLDHLTAVGGVDELTVADVDTDMGDAGLVSTCEEHQITGLQVALGNVGAHLVLIDRGAVGGRDH